MKIPLQLIESYLNVVESESLDSAAKKLGLTQSALSRQMKHFESLLPYKVFEMSGRSKRITKYGKVLYDLLSPKFESVEHIIRQASTAFAEEDMADVRIGGRGEILDRFAMNLKFRGKVEFLQLDNEKTISSILNGSCDIGIVNRVVDSHDIIIKPLFQDTFRIIIPKKILRQFPTSKGEQTKALVTLPCLVYKNSDSIIDKSLRHRGISYSDLNISRIYSNYSAIGTMVEKGMGWAILPSHIQLSKNENHIVELKGLDLGQEFYLCYRKEFSNVEWFKKLVKDIQALS